MKLAQAFDLDNRIHTLHAGRCTMHRSPGYFATFRDVTGNTIYGPVEAHTVDEAIALLCGQLSVMPGLTIR